MMPNQERVLHGLDSCGFHDGIPNICEVTECPYRDVKCGCVHELAHDAGLLISELLKAQEPRVMTLEEVIEHYSLPPVFPDDLGMQENYYEDIQPLYFEFPHDNGDPWIVHWRGYSKVARYLNEWRHTYNQKWRCWTSRPDKATREATPWN